MSQAPPFGVPPNSPRPGYRSGTAPQRRQGSPADKAITIVLICLAPLVCLGTSAWGFFSVMATASCGSDCGGAVDTAVPLMIFSPWVVWLIVTVWSIVHLSRRRPAAWVMLLGLGVATVIYVAANIVLFIGVG
ncbi:hypothetical protein ABZ234_10520 [Nocardiopsis sp. NPDC006198]|uniref:Transmembrane protein n=1 Tax=Streptomonospora nanhaiensis TaxID=1323731 RepID=A0ABY6YJC7_9ACTN|nr:hypothetical protein [Streptomonospora nanhaiensis]WAE72301.1 hypothetical protein OUQ99_24295 [Streptomonospora nanhaiensis]